MVVECCFDRDGDVYVSTEAGLNRVSLYDVRSGQRRAQFHLEPRNGAASVVSVAANVKQAGDGVVETRRRAKRSRRKAVDKEGEDGAEEEEDVPTVEETATTLVAVGYTSGALTVFSSTREDAVQIDRTGLKKGAGVTAVVFQMDGSLLFAATENRSVACWHAQSGHQTLLRKNVDVATPTCLALSPSGKVLAVAASQITLLDTDSLQVMRKFVGHASTVQALTFAGETELYSSCEGDNHISMWDLRKDDSTASASYLSSSPASLLAAKEKEPHLAAVGSSDQVAAVFLRAQPGRAVATIRGAVLSVALSPGGRITVAHGNKFAPRFDCFDVEEGAVMLASPDATDRRGRSGQPHAATAVEVLSGERDAKILDFRDFSEAEGGANDGMGLATEEGDQAEDLEDSDLTIEEKLAKIGVVHASQRDAASLHRREEHPAGGPDSIASILVQALETKDAVLLETALTSVQKRSTIAATIEKLPAKHVVPLVSALATRMQSKPRRVDVLSIWLRTVLTEHVAMFNEASGPEVSKALSDLYHCIEERVRLHQKLAMLEGRLELVLTQAKKVALNSEAVESEPILDLNCQDGDPPEADPDSDSESSLEGSSSD